MNELTAPIKKTALPIISLVTFVGFLDTHLLIPVMALYAEAINLTSGTEVAGVSAPVPEPGAALLFGVGALVIRRRLAIGA